MLCKEENFQWLYKLQELSLFFYLYVFGGGGVSVLTELISLTAGKKVHLYRDCAFPCHDGEPVLRYDVGRGCREVSPAQLRVPRHAGQQGKVVGCITTKQVRKIGACCANPSRVVWEVRWTEATGSAAVLEQETLYFHFFCTRARLD